MKSVLKAKKNKKNLKIIFFINNKLKFNDK